LTEINSHFKQISDKFDVVLIEEPAAFVRQGAYGIKNLVPIHKLMMSMGAIIGALSDRYKVVLVKVSDWKGTGKKVDTQLIAKDITGKKLNTHESDALVMSLNWLRFVRYKVAIRNAKTANPVIKRMKIIG